MGAGGDAHGLDDQEGAAYGRLGGIGSLAEVADEGGGSLASAGSLDLGLGWNPYAFRTRPCVPFEAGERPEFGL